MRPAILAAFILASTCLGQKVPVVHTLETNRGTVAYSIDGPFAVTEGDIILGPATEIEAQRLAQETGAPALQPHSLTTNSAALWPGGTIYYAIDADVPNQQSVLDGIAYWNTYTSLQILPRTNQTNYVHFQHVNIDAACNSYIGMIGGGQALGVTNNCPTGSVIHELGHAFGLWHEQQRTDRNSDLTVLYENIDKRFIGNFPQATTADDRGYYDFDSIMHYSAFGFSRNFLDSLETVPPGIPIGQRVGLSPGDLDGVSRLYKVPITSTVISTTPSGLIVTVDGVAAVSPRSFDWAAGTQHTVSVTPTQGTEPRYSFARWSDGGAAAHTITTSTSVTGFNVQFVRQHIFSAGVSSGQGSVSVFPAPGDGYVTERTPLRITATPAAGYRFVRWVGTSLSALGQGISSNPAFVEAPNGITSYAAVFTTAPVSTVDSLPHGALILVDGGSYYTPANFTWTPGSTHTLGYTTPQLFGNSTSRLQFTQWDAGSPGTRTITAGQTSATYVATFSQQYLLTYETSGSGAVSAAPPSDDGFYDAGATVTLTAVPGPGQTLRYWLGDVAGGALTSTVRMDQQRDATAYFGSALTQRILNAASFLSTSAVASTSIVIAPGEILAIFGTNLGPATGLLGAVGSDGKIPFSLGGTSVTFDGVPAPILYSSATQLDVIVPYAVAGKPTSLVRIASAAATVLTTVNVAATAPAIFAYDGSGSGQAAAINEDGTINSPSNPAAPGSVVVLYATGAGAFDKTFPDGQILGIDLGHTAAPVLVRFGKLAGAVLYAGTAPYLVNGALQVNVRIPAEVIGGAPVPVQLIAGTAGSQTGITISVSASPN